MAKTEVRNTQNTGINHDDDIFDGFYYVITNIGIISVGYA